jgi:hypothetical protein
MVILGGVDEGRHPELLRPPESKVVARSTATLSWWAGCIPSGMVASCVMTGVQVIVDPPRTASAPPLAHPSLAAGVYI